MKSKTAIRASAWVLKPQWWQIYFRSRRRPLIREPHGYADTVPARPLPIIPKPSKWLR
jgi:hypothetical protein